MRKAEFANLTGRGAVVTGASSGIGRAIAVELAQAGAELYLTCGSSAEKLRETVDILGEASSRTHTFVGDLAEVAVCERLVEDAWSKLAPPTIWINNAGVDLLTGSAARLGYDEKLSRLWEVDVQTTIRLSREAGSRMKSAGEGVIVNIGWDQADRGMEGDSGELFATAKNAIMGFTRSLSVSLAPQVRVNCVAPGWIKTAWGEGASEYWNERVRRETPLDRWGTPQDIAKAVRFLCSDDASFITGQVINVNGGAVR
ncbi:MAG: SDR family oxidoreductase [Planctomycetaceae bacterium]|nr:SDR family oxidoreductase [Planctomycetaceae bacterium]